MVSVVHCMLAVFVNVSCLCVKHDQCADLLLLNYRSLRAAHNTCIGVGIYIFLSLFVFLQVLWPKKGAFDNANDLKEQAFYRFIAKTYWGHIALQFALLYAIGGMQWFVWLGCVRVGGITLQTHMVLMSCSESVGPA